MSFQFVPVTPANRVQALSLGVAPGQEHTVEPVAECLAEADRLALWRPVLVLDGAGQAVGFAMYGFWDGEDRYGRVWLDRFFIDRNFQRRGYAKACLPRLIDKLRAEYPAARQALYLSVYADNAPAIALYRALGFAFNGERDVNGELVMCLTA